MANLANLYLFMTNADQYGEFLHRVEGAVYIQAVALREEDLPNPVTAAWRARRQWVVSVPSPPQRKAKEMRPGLLEAGQLATVTDNQILATIAGLDDAYAGYIPGLS